MACVAMAHALMAYVLMADIVMLCVIMAYIRMASTVMASIVMAFIVTVHTQVCSALSRVLTGMDVPKTRAATSARTAASAIRGIAPWQATARSAAQVSLVATDVCSHVYGHVCMHV